MKIRNKIGFVFCLIGVANYWLRYGIDKLVINIPIFNLDFFDFLEGGELADPIDYAFITIKYIYYVLSYCIN